MTFRLMAVLAAAACIGFAIGCGDDDDDDGVAKASCDSQCEAQDSVEGCEPFVDLSTCKLLCGSLVREYPQCQEEFVAYYDCSANQGFECGVLGVTQDPEPCKNAQDELDACQGTPMCVGADDAGRCPSVSCPCPEGATDVSGFTNESGECRCYDEETCVDFFCD